MSARALCLVTEYDLSRVFSCSGKRLSVGRLPFPFIDPARTNVRISKESKVNGASRVLVTCSLTIR